ncbi:hypothetical protein H6P81_017266 [Aristolochia fimbriata]|uniref:Protein kinase domain-containing protein n=1 Tax=Aristolochia fimbriata TaxID=158543 RepID=A0AAV7DXV8_ARIFI|nr:hypothetical protein H6P81_017266 [Aristolochia fimbriata]
MGDCCASSREIYQGFCSPSEGSRHSASSPEPSLRPPPGAREYYEGLMSPDSRDLSVRSTEIQTRGSISDQASVQGTLLAVEVYQQDGLGTDSPQYDLIDQITTDGFERKFGRGQFGVVYPGQMGDGTNVLVKIFARKPSDSIEFRKQFKLQTELLMRLKTEKLFCTVRSYYQGNRMHLLLEFMPIGSPTRLLQVWKPMSREQRSQIDVAQGGLQYCKQPIIRGHVKMNPALPHEGLRAVFTDYWLSKFVFEMFFGFLPTSIVNGTDDYWFPGYALSDYPNKENEVSVLS